MKNIILAFFVLLMVGCTFTRSEDQQVLHKNYIFNGGFENGKTGWSVSGTGESFVIQDTEKSKGNWSAEFDSSATGQYLLSKLMDVPEELKGQQCLVAMDYKTAANNEYTLAKHNCSGSAVGLINLPSSSDFTRSEVGFTCPTSGSVCLIIQSTADSAPIYLDNMYIGRNHNYTVGGDGLTFTPPNSMSVNVAAPVSISGDNVTIASQAIQTAHLDTSPAAVDTAQIRDNAVTTLKQASRQVRCSSLTSNSANHTSSTWTGIIATSSMTIPAGRAVWVYLNPFSGTDGENAKFGPVGGSMDCAWRFYASWGTYYGYTRIYGAGATALQVPVMGMGVVLPGAPSGSWTFQLQGKSTGGTTCWYANLQICAMEL